MTLDLLFPFAGCVALALLFLHKRFLDAAVGHAVQRETDKMERKLSRKHAAEIAEVRSWARSLASRQSSLEAGIEDLTLRVQQLGAMMVQALGAARSSSSAGDAGAEVGRRPRAQSGEAVSGPVSSPRHGRTHQQAESPARVAEGRPISPPRSGRSAENGPRFTEAAGSSSSSKRPGGHRHAMHAKERASRVCGRPTS